jgi:predicted Holliday junction resolvase-like endonuclease
MEPVLTFLGHPTVNTFVLAVAVYFLKDFAVAVKDLKREIEEHKLEVAREYATKEEVSETIERHEKLLHHK